MKKLLLTSLLTFGFCTAQLSAMEEREDGTRTPSSKSNNATMYEEEQKEQDSLNYIINCADEKSLEIDKSQFEKLKTISGTIAHLMQDINDTTTLECNIIPLQQLESNVVQDILALIGTMPQEQTAEYTKFIEQLSQRSLDNLISLLMTANYLDIQSLLDLLSKTIAHKIIKEISKMPTGNFSQKIIYWLQHNRNELELGNLPAELLNAIAIQIIEQNPRIKHIMLPAQILTENTSRINCLTWSHDGSTLVSGSARKTIRLWKKNSDKNFTLKNILLGHTRPISYLVWSPDGYTLASASFDNTIRLWKQDSDNFTSKTILSGHEDFFYNDQGSISRLAWNPDGTILASSGFFDSSIRLWACDSNNNLTLKDILTNNEDQRRHVGVDYLAWSSDGTTLTARSGYNLKKINLWTCNSDNKWTKDSNNNSDNTCTHKEFCLPEGLKLVYCLACNSDGSTIASVSKNNTAIIHIMRKDSDNNPISQDLSGHTNWISCFAWSPDGNILASGSEDKTIRIWTKLSYKNFTLEQAFVLLIWQQSQIDKTSFEIPQEESLENAFEVLPENLKNFLTNKEQ